jgi:hypothetical protein
MEQKLDSLIRSTTQTNSYSKISYFTDTSNMFLDIFIVLSLSKNRPVYFSKTQRFGDWILSPFSGKTYSVGSNR